MLLILALAPKNRNTAQTEQSRAPQNKNARLRHGRPPIAFLWLVIAALTALGARVRLGGDRRKQSEAKSHNQRNVFHHCPPVLPECCPRTQLRATGRVGYCIYPAKVPASTRPQTAKIPNEFGAMFRYERCDYPTIGCTYVYSAFSQASPERI